MCDIDQRVFTRDFKDFFCQLLHYLSPRVMILVDAVSKAAQNMLLMLHFINEVRNVLDEFNLLEHVDDRFTCASMSWTEQSSK